MDATLDERLNRTNMNKTENLYSVLIGLEANMQKLRNEERILDYRVQEIFTEWMNAERFNRTINPDKKHGQCRVVDLMNTRVAEIERRLRCQRALHASLMRVYEGLLRVQFAKFLN